MKKHCILHAIFYWWSMRRDGRTSVARLSSVNVVKLWFGP